jgi:phosphoribosylamine--glycine ligase/phosphoribosylformylglycinamidine cyclo-ligase
MVNFLILGSGAREYTIVKRLILDKVLTDTVFVMGTFENIGIMTLGVQIEILHKENLEIQILNYAVDNDIDIVIPGSEVYLDTNLYYNLKQNNIDFLGPSKEYAKLETDKEYARELFKGHEIGRTYIPDYKVIRSMNEMNDIVLTNFPVIKPAYIHSGKGVKIYGKDMFTLEEAFEYIKSFVINNEPVILEELLEGKEFTLQSITDGNIIIHTFPIQDYKRLGDNNTLENTGSMGCVSMSNHSLPFLNEIDLEVARNINKNALELLPKSDIEVYKGFIYGSFIKTNSGDIKIIEFNARLGDPEGIPIINLMKENLRHLFIAMCNSELNLYPISFKCNNSLSTYLVPEWYPGKFQHETDNILNTRTLNLNELRSIYYASLSNLLEMNNSRSMVIYLSDKDLDIDTLRRCSFDIINKIEGKFKYRRDIGVFNNKSIDYKNAGVDIEKGNEIVGEIQNKIYETQKDNENVVSSLGDFSGMVRCTGNKILVSTIDGVGTKTSFIPEIVKDIRTAYNILGEDIVNHCVNDTLVKGAEPLMFLDYIASGFIDKEKILSIVEGMTKACINAKCPLIGGETAEMPGVYKENSYDIVGTMIGSVSEEDIIDGKKNVNNNCVIFGLPSDGLHTNGYSLVRKLYSENDSFRHYIKINYNFFKWISAPHKSYLKDIQTIIKGGIDIKALCHITGGGFIDNPKRVVPENVFIEFVSYSELANEHFKTLQKFLQISDQEMLRTFNCGYGMIVFIENDKTKIQKMEDLLKKNCIHYNLIGKTY